MKTMMMMVMMIKILNKGGIEGTGDFKILAKKRKKLWQAGGFDSKKCVPLPTTGTQVPRHSCFK